MTTSTLDVGDLFSVLGAQGIERQLQRVAGVGRVSVNPVSGSTTVMYDPEKTSLAAIRAAIEDCGFHCAGEALPRHVCEDHSMSGISLREAPISEIEPAVSEAHAGHAATAPAGIKSAGAKVDHKAHGGENSDAMAHEMGHGAGVDMQAMVRDMRNRFWIALAFSLPIFVFSPMGMDFIQIRPPFGMRLDLVLFVLASGAILYPVWPFIVAAYRALRSGVANMAVLVVLSVGHRIPVQRRLYLLLWRPAVLRGVGNPAGLHPARTLARNACTGRRVRSHPRAHGSGAAQGNRAA